jgi:hypothetical protein
MNVADKSSRGGLFMSPQRFSRKFLCLRYSKAFKFAPNKPLWASFLDHLISLPKSSSSCTDVFFASYTPVPTAQMTLYAESWQRWSKAAVLIQLTLRPICLRLRPKALRAKPYKTSFYF